MENLPEKIEVDREALYQLLVTLSHPGSQVDISGPLAILIKNHDDAINAATGMLPPTSPE